MEKADFNELFQWIISRNKESYEKWLKEKEQQCIETERIGNDLRNMSVR